MDTDGEIYGIPGYLWQKYPLLSRNVYEHREGIKRWLKVLATP
jgi:hypothetical protein